jgi:uncharacterized phage-associated protein
MTNKVDARALANSVLTEAWGRGMQVSNLKLQKLVFLCHAFLLVEKSKDVVRGEFVAWKYGPVHKDVYDAFKSHGSRSIDALAVRINPVTGQQTTVESFNDRDVRDVVNRVVGFYGDWTPGQLVKLTHAEGGPWDFVVKSASTSANVGLRIANDVIEQRFKYLWFGAKHDFKDEEPNEDQPLVA